MARVRTNSALLGISGEIDGFVFKTCGGKTFLQKKPTFTKPWSEGTVTTRKTFKAASDFAEIIKADPLLREIYRKRGQHRRRRVKLNYRQMALRDAFHPPTVDRLDTSRYTRAKGGRIEIFASDDFAVVGVHVVLRDAAGLAVADVEASPTGIWHVNVAPPVSAAAAPVTAEVVARDRPGNTAMQVFKLP